MTFVLTLLIWLGAPVPPGCVVADSGMAVCAEDARRSADSGDEEEDGAAASDSTNTRSRLGVKPQRAQAIDISNGF